MTHPSHASSPPLAALAFAARQRAGGPRRCKLATSVGDIVIELDAQKAPKSVANFSRT